MKTNLKSSKCWRIKLKKKQKKKEKKNEKKKKATSFTILMNNERGGCTPSFLE
jgi:hypothetical protein